MVSWTESQVIAHEQKLRKPDPTAPPNAVERESKLHEEIMRHCDHQWPRWKYIHCRMDRESTIAVGAPDFVIALPGGRVIWIECKAKDGKRSVEQLAWATQMEMLGHTVHLVRSFEEFLELAR